MKQTCEFAGKDLNTAIKNACTTLKLSTSEVKYDVISEGASGIFGIVGRKDARIKVFLPDKENIESIVDEALGEEKQIQKTQKIQKAQKIKAGEILEQDIDLGVEILQKMVDLITDDAKITTKIEHDCLMLNIQGGNSSVLIGKRGQTIYAMQLLIDKILNKNKTERIKIKIDVEGYIKTRETSLYHLAEKMANKVKKTGKPVTISQMNSKDRYILKMALENDSMVRTHTSGDGYYRRFVISLKKRIPLKKNKFFQK